MGLPPQPIGGWQPGPRRSEGLGEWDDEPDDIADAAEPPGTTWTRPELFYPNLAEFVRNKLAVTYRRQRNVQGGITWCRQWWKHAEAISRLEALWRAWEHLRLEGTTGMSVWWRDHADHHIQRLQPRQRPPRQARPPALRRTPAGLF
ncbi:DUF4913 domain-containing protein [Sinomonas humi]|uniref:DUF4913 domain-containing protein n=1 Tax=Sinomonas humi TaxID=1338436 RepID=UPI001E4B2705|nr:DUF4913 domain-containing protein [Sinomonas humi]